MSYPSRYIRVAEVQPYVLHRTVALGTDSGLISLLSPLLWLVDQSSDPKK
jgi:hypothetical protein